MLSIIYITLRELKNQEREINDEYRKILLKREEIRKKEQLPTFNGKLNKKRKENQFVRHELNDFIR